MVVLTIGSDRKIFEEGSKSREKAKEIATLFKEYYIIVFAEKSLGLKIERISKNAWVVPTNSSNRWLYIFDALKIGKKMSGIDVISCQDPFESGLAGYFLSRSLKAKLQIQIHTDFLSKYFKTNALNKLRVFIANFILPKADLIRVVSLRIKNSLKTYKLKTEPKVLPVFVDVKKITESLPEFDLKSRYKDFSKIVLMISRLEKEKNIELALDVFKSVLGRQKKTALVIVGDGSERKDLEKKVKDLGIKKNVFFEGWQADTNSYYKGSDIYLSTSDYEGYGLSMVDAAFSGLPVVTTNVGVAGEILINGMNAKVCPVGDKNCLVRAVIDLIEDKELFDKLKGNANKVSMELVSRSKYEYLEKYYNTFK